MSDDAALVDGLRRGNPASFDQTYAAYGPRVFSFLLRLSGRRDTAEDLAQETWLKLARAAPNLDRDTRLGPLLFTIARNAFISHRRWAMLDLSRFVVVGYEILTAIGGPDSPEADHERARELALLEAGLQKLPLPAREVLLLIGVEGLEHEEVARILGLSAEALRQRLSRARKQLADVMARMQKPRPAQGAPT